MKILLVSSNSSSTGGGELFFIKIARHFIERGEYVTIAYSDNNQFDGLAKSASDIGCKVLRYPYERVYDRRFRSLELFFVGRSKGVSSISLDSYDVVHVSQQNIEDGIDIVATLGQICPERMVVTIHVVEWLNRLGQRFGTLRQVYPKYVYNLLHENVRFAFLSNYAQQLFSEMFCVQPRNSRVIYNGAERSLSTGNQIKYREELGINSTDFVIGSIGRLEEEKNYKTLLKAFASVQQNIGKTRLLLVGDGSQRNELTVQARNLGVGDNLIITGWVPDPSPFLDIMDTFVLPSWFEGFPFALVEALISEKVCLASSIPPHVECLSNETTLLFSPANYIDLGNALMRVAKKDIHTFEAARRAIDNAHSKFTMDIMINELLEFYRVSI